MSSNHVWVYIYILPQYTHTHTHTMLNMRARGVVVSGEGHVVGTEEEMIAGIVNTMTKAFIDNQFPTPPLSYNATSTLPPSLFSCTCVLTIFLLHTISYIDPSISLSLSLYTYMSLHVTSYTVFFVSHTVRNSLCYVPFFTHIAHTSHFSNICPSDLPPNNIVCVCVCDLIF